MKRHGWLGLGLMLAAEILLYGDVRAVATFFTPLMWTGYILFADGIVAARDGKSWLTTRRREFVSALAAECQSALTSPRPLQDPIWGAGMEKA